MFIKPSRLIKHSEFFYELIEERGINLLLSSGQ